MSKNAKKSARKKRVKTTVREQATDVQVIINEADKLIPELLDLLRNKTGTDPFVAVAAIVMAAHVILEATSNIRITGPKERERFRRSAACVAAHASKHAQSKLDVILPTLKRRRRESEGRI